MRQINRLVAVLVSFAALVQTNCVAQEFKNKFKPRVVFERDFLHTPLGTNAIFKGILNRRGTELLLNDTANTQIIVVDTKNVSSHR